jgi:hypothetical protein
MWLHVSTCNVLLACLQEESEEEKELQGDRNTKQVERQMEREGWTDKRTQVGGGRGERGGGRGEDPIGGRGGRLGGGTRGTRVTRRCNSRFRV